MWTAAFGTLRTSKQSCVWKGCADDTCASVADNGAVLCVTPLSSKLFLNNKRNWNQSYCRCWWIIYSPFRFGELFFCRKIKGELLCQKSREFEFKLNSILTRTGEPSCSLASSKKMGHLGFLWELSWYLLVLLSVTVKNRGSSSKRNWMHSFQKTNNSTLNPFNKRSYEEAFKQRDPLNRFS